MQFGSFLNVVFSSDLLLILEVYWWINKYIPFSRASVRDETKSSGVTVVLTTFWRLLCIYKSTDVRENGIYLFFISLDGLVLLICFMTDSSLVKTDRKEHTTLSLKSTQIHAGANHPPKRSPVSATNAFFIIAVLPKSIFRQNFRYGVISEWIIFWCIADIKYRYYDVTMHVATFWRY